jgi:hypothetical protein
MKLTVGMATYDDYDGVYFSVLALRLYHPEIAADIEIVVVDNHPSGPCAADLQALANWIPSYRYIPFDRVQGTAACDLVFREAAAPFVLAMDCHVMFAPGSLRKLIDYFQAHPDTPDLLQGPLLYDNLDTISSHMDPVWSSGMYGVWGSDPRASDPAAEPFEIGMQGMGVFACRKSAWPGFNPRLKGFGGGEGYIQEKIRRAGGRALCLPFLRWIHRFGRPMGVPYTNTWEDRVRNYLIIADELGLDPTPAIDHFRAHLGHPVTDRAVAATQNELRSPFHFFDAIYCINSAGETARWQQVSAHFARLGIAHRVRRFEALPTLSHRAVVEEAKRLGLGNVLVFEDDAVPDPQTALTDIRGRDWLILSLGPHAVAYHHSAYDQILTGTATADLELCGSALNR